MPTLETAIRLMVIGQALLVAAVFLFGKGGHAARISGTLVMLGVAAYLYSSGALWGSLPRLEPLILLVTMAVPFLVWSFARSIFDSPWPPLPVTAGIGLLLVVAWLMQVVDGLVEPEAAGAASLMLRSGGLVAMAHALWLAWWGRPDDLIERRRRFRLLFVAVIAWQVAAVLAVELVFGPGRVPAWLDMTKVFVIAAMMLVLAIPMLRLRRVFFEPDRPVPAVAAGDGEPATAQDVYHRKLLALMHDGCYRETGLTIAVLAGKLAVSRPTITALVDGL
ncbi:MAG: hypothetical protein MJA32_14215, partial [Proteobacteria bacterium]|nr:hypothetical protein [Pseudomonadota bacterium]